jgi:hypothetical protein
MAESLKRFESLVSGVPEVGTPEPDDLGVDKDILRAFLKREDASFILAEIRSKNPNATELDILKIYLAEMKKVISENKSLAVKDEDLAKFRAVCKMVALGLEVEEIARISFLELDQVKEYLSTAAGKNLVVKYQDEIFLSDVQKGFEKHALDALDTVKSVLTDDSEKTSDRMRAAEIILDRSFGKPEQKTTVEGSLLADFIARVGQDSEDERVVDEVDVFADNLIASVGDGSVGARDRGAKDGE